MLKTCSTPQPGRMAQPGISDKKHQGRLEVDPWGFGVGDTEDPRPAILPLKKRFWQHVKAFELLQKWFVLKHSSSSTVTASPGLDVQTEGPLYASCH